jgi:hypothetical protein
VRNSSLDFFLHLVVSFACVLAILQEICAEEMKQLIVRSILVKIMGLVPFSTKQFNVPALHSLLVISVNLTFFLRLPLALVSMALALKIA